MVNPAATERSHIEAVFVQDGIYVSEVCDVILGLIFPDGRNKPPFAQVCNGGVEIIRVFLPEDPFQFLAVIPGAGLEIPVTVEDIEKSESPYRSDHRA